jgi:serine/threonine-protein kinase
MPRNPYLNRVAIKDPAQFFGRTREVSKIFSRIGASRPQSLSVVGERRIGKSSLLNFVNDPQVRRRFLDRSESYAFAFIDLQQKRRLTLIEFFKDLFTLLAKETGDKSLSKLQPSFDSLRAVLENFRRDGRKLVVLFDEFDAITTNQAFDLEFYSFLRSIANNYDVAYVTSSARDLQELCHTQLIADSPFFNIFTNVFLRAFTRKEALELINKPSAGSGMPLEGYGRRITEIAGYFPYFLQIACSAYFDHLQENDGKLDREEVEATFLDEAKGQFRFIWDHMSDSFRRSIREFIENGRVEKMRGPRSSRMK